MMEAFPYSGYRTEVTPICRRNLCSCSGRYSVVEDGDIPVPPPGWPLRLYVRAHPQRILSAYLSKYLRGVFCGLDFTKIAKRIEVRYDMHISRIVTMFHATLPGLVNDPSGDMVRSLGMRIPMFPKFRSSISRFRCFSGDARLMGFPVFRLIL